MKRCLSLISLLLLSNSVNALEVEPYIVNGNTANIVNYPSFASLFYRNNSVYSSSSYCGATMINANYALTAAHCIYGDSNLMLYTVVTPQLEDEENFLSNQQARASEFYYPDTYVDSSTALWPDDIAIIKVETPLSVSNYSSLLNTTTNDVYPSGGDYKAIGHGLENGNTAGGTQLLETTLTFVSNSACGSYYGANLTSSQVCFSGGVSNGYQNSTCSGDSGGPVYWYNGSQYIQIGITSFGPTLCGDTSEPISSVFTEIYDYQNWINRVITGLESPKYYVQTVNGRRTLIENSSGNAVESETVTEQSGGGGGSVNLWWLFGLFFCFLWRTNEQTKIYIRG